MFIKFYFLLLAVTTSFKSNSLSCLSLTNRPYSVSSLLYSPFCPYRLLVPKSYTTSSEYSYTNSCYLPSYRHFYRRVLKGRGSQPTAVYSNEEMAQTPSDDNNTLPRLSDVKSVLGKNREYIRRCIGADGVMDEFLRKMNGNLESSVDNFDSAMNAFLQKLDDGSSNLQQEVDQFLSILKDLHQHCHQTLYAMLRRGIPCSDDDKKSYKNNIGNTIYHVCYFL